MFSAANMATLAAWLLHPATATLETSSKLLDTRFWHLPSFVMWHDTLFKLTFLQLVVGDPDCGLPAAGAVRLRP